MDILLIVLLAGLLVFMFWNSRRRMQKMRAEQEEKRSQTVAGARVLLQGGLYGTIVSYDPEDLDRPAEVEIAPGVIIEVHSQAIVRIITEDAEGDVHTEADFTEANYAEAIAEADAEEIERIDEREILGEHERIDDPESKKPSDHRPDA